MTDIYEVQQYKLYTSLNSGVEFFVLGFCRHAQDCSIRMVRYVNTQPTHDYNTAEEWVMEEATFIKRFTEKH